MREGQREAPPHAAWRGCPRCLRSANTHEKARALETKFLRLDTRQEQDSVLSFPPSAGAGTGEWSGPQPAAVQAWALATTNSRRKARRSGQSTRQQGQRLCTDSFCVFPFFGEGCGDPLLLLPRPSFCVLAERRQRGQPRRAACGGASRWPRASASARRTSRAAASGLRRWPIYDNAV